MNETIVLKFGGSSLGAPDALAASLQIVSAAAAEARPVVVVSALGGATDVVADAVRDAAAGRPSFRAVVPALRARHLAALADVADGPDAAAAAIAIEGWLSRLDALLDEIAAARRCPAGTRDLALSVGERLAAPLFAAALRARGVEARSRDAARFVRTDSRPGEAEVDHRATAALVRRELDDGGPLPVVTGFLGADAHGATTLLGRGGSDYTAALVAAALQAPRLEIWTDVAGVFAADPRVVEGARPLPRLGYGEAAELALFGAKVLHPRTIEPLAAQGIVVAIRGTLERGAAGTTVGPLPAARRGRPLGAAADRGAALAALRGVAGGRAHELLPRAAAALAGAGVHALLLGASSAGDEIVAALAAGDIEDGVAALGREFARDVAAGRIERLDRRDDAAVVGVVGEGCGARPETRARLDAALARAGADVVVPAVVASSRGVAAIVAAASGDVALRAAHDELVEPRPRVDVLLAGATGHVGRALRAQLARRAPDADVALRLVGVASSRRAAWRREGIAPLEAERALESGDAAGPLPLVERLVADGAADAPLVLVDCTASAALAARYADLLERGVGVVTPNKLAAAAPLAQYRRVRDASARSGAPYRYETTVGAALPVLGPIADLARSGDRILGLDAVLSGTLSFVFGRVNEGERFSAAAREARGLGLTEPHPRDDLSGADVARKLVILLREAGFALELGDVVVERIVPPAVAAENDPERFLERLAAEDERWARRAADAAARGRRLVHCATFDGAAARVGVREAAADDPLARARRGENVVVCRSERYRDVPLTIAGPGAGPEVTAAGVLVDLLAAARELAS